MRSARRPPVRAASTPVPPGVDTASRGPADGRLPLLLLQYLAILGQPGHSGGIAPVPAQGFDQLPFIPYRDRDVAASRHGHNHVHRFAQVDDVPDGTVQGILTCGYFVRTRDIHPLGPDCDPYGAALLKARMPRHSKTFVAGLTNQPTVTRLLLHLALEKV